MGIKGPVESTWTEALVPFPEGHPIGKPEPLFSRIEPPKKDEIATASSLVKVTEKEEKKDAPNAEKAEPKPSVVPFDEFARLDLRVGKVLEIEPHPKADKLYVLKVDLGEPQPRQIVAGLRKHYEAQDILGKSIIVVANLQPVKMRGIESNGMLLAGDDGTVVSLLTLDRYVRPGSPVH